MNSPSSSDYLVSLVNELRKLPVETDWVEFKDSNSSPEMIGERISSLSNTAALNEKAQAYMVWGIRDADHEIIGTTFRPFITKKGNENLENWLLHQLTPRIPFRFFESQFEGKLLVVLEIPRATGRPVQFEGTEYLRVGSYTKKLKDFPELEQKLWRVFDTTPFEELKALERLPGDEVLRLLDVQAFLDGMGIPFPKSSKTILERLEENRLIVKDDAGGWSIQNLGAMLFAKNLEEFPRLGRKALRVIVHKGKSRFASEREEVFRAGYGISLEQAQEFIKAVVPRNEEIKKSLRREVPMYPELAVRELVANALIHQDFQITGAGSMVEIFDGRMEITNPGAPLVDTQRFLDSPPRSRNEALASFMRRLGKCEERGSGVDKVVIQTEVFQLPAPAFEKLDDSTRAILFAHKTFAEMDRDDRIRACYLHAGLKWLQREPMTNSSLRERFGIEEKNSSMVSRIIGDTKEAGLIKPFDEQQAKKNARYLPIWA